MKIIMSPNVAVRTKRFQEAIDFYTKVMGFENKSNDPNLGDLDASPLRWFILEDDELEDLVHELFVEDLEVAREYFEKNGCEVIRWRGKGQDCYIRDPFGVVYNIWET